MTLRKYSIIAAVLAAAHFAFAVTMLLGSVALAMNRTATEPRGLLESTMMTTMDVLLIPLGMLCEPVVNTPVVAGLIAVAANSVLWGCVLAMVVSAVIAARAKRVAF